MSERPENPPAFPCPEFLMDPEGNDWTGMDLRTYLAAQMAPILWQQIAVDWNNNRAPSDNRDEVKRCAESAFALSDALLSERSKGAGDG